MYCVIEFGNSVNVMVKGKRLICKCCNFQSIVGFCFYVFVVVDIMGIFLEFVEIFNRKEGKVSSIF